MSHVLIVCGGTGGHLAPGIAVAEELLARGHTCKLVISRKDVDSKLIAKYSHLESVRVPGRALGGGLTGVIRTGIDLVRGGVFAIGLLKREQPDRVLAFGGFLSLGVIIAARLRAVPIALHEANNRTGRVIRWMRRFADRIYLPPTVRLRGVGPKVIRHMGYPVRRDVQHILKADAAQQLGIRVVHKLLVVIGGSQGAESLNQWSEANFPRLAALGVTVYCVTGRRDEPARVLTATSLDSDDIHCYFVPFSDAMGAVISAADLIISRAGAGSIAEITHCRAPSILIPYPYAADDHQEANARQMERNGACIVLNQGQLKDLLHEVEETIFNDWLLCQFKKNLARIDKGDPAAEIVQDIEGLALAAKTGVSADTKEARV